MGFLLVAAAKREREAEYADVDRVLDELAERGYDRSFESMPSRTGSPPTHMAESPRRSQPGLNRPDSCGETTTTWSSGHDTSCSVSSAGLPIVDCRQGSRPGSPRTRKNGTHTFGHRRTSAGSGTKPCPSSRTQGLGETVRYVDLCNEWPGWSPGVTEQIFGGSNPTDRAWTESEIGRIDAYQESLQQIRDKHPDYPLTLSWFPRTVQTGPAEDLQRLSTSGQDLADVHLWLSLVCPQFIDQTPISRQLQHGRHQPGRARTSRP